MPYKNKQDQALAARKFYLKNKVEMKEKAKAFSILARERNRKFIDEYLRDHACVDCGQRNIVTLQFDHVRGEKEMEISLMVQAPRSIASIQKEIEKCEVRCANCHLIRHNS